MNEPWATLVIAPTENRAAIRRAYAAALKAIDPEADPAAFIALREARDLAMAMADAGRLPREEPADDAGRSTPEPSASPTGPARRAGPERGDGQPAPLVPEIDEAALARLHALAMDDRAVPEDLLAAARAVLDSPAMESLQQGLRVEGMLAELIVETTPRSDALLDLAVERFRWAERFGDLDRPPLVGWILDRKAERDHERVLPIAGSQYSFGAGTGGAPRQRYVDGSYLPDQPLFFNGVGQPAADWPRQAPEPSLAYLDLRPNAGQRVLLWGGILLFPYIFVWLLLRQGHSAGERIVGFAWLAAVAAVIALGGSGDPPGTRQAAVAPTVAAPLPYAR